MIGSIKPRTAERLRKLPYEGLTLSPTSIRRYPDGRLASQATGYLGDYGEPFGGIESRYDEKLEAGQNVEVTIDAAVQQQLEKELRGVIEEHGAKGTLGLVMRVDDGAIVALAGAPSFDNNEFEEVEPELQRNRILTDPYEPGSTFKTVQHGGGPRGRSRLDRKLVHHPRQHPGRRPGDPRLRTPRNKGDATQRHTRTIQQRRNHTGRPATRRGQAGRLPPALRFRRAYRCGPLWRRPRCSAGLRRLERLFDRQHSYRTGAYGNTASARYRVRSARKRREPK